jgi:hypothetical protein
LAVDIDVALCDMRAALSWVAYGGGAEYLPEIEMLIDASIACGDRDVLCRAYAAEARIYRNPLGSSPSGVESAIEATELAIDVAKSVWAQDVLPALYADVFRWAYPLGLREKAAHALIECLRGSLLTAQNVEEEFIQALLDAARQWVDDTQFSKEREWIMQQLDSMGFQKESE